MDTTKSPNDKREYRRLVLENQLEVLLIVASASSKLPPSTAAAGIIGDKLASTTTTSIVSATTNSIANPVDDSDSDPDNDSDSNDSDSNDSDVSEDGNEAKRAAVAMSVGVGSFCEDRRVMGLAHYLEHMVFMGSEKYPDENEFENYLSRHGGGSNGSTDCESTNYVFEVDPEHLEGGLDRFAQFFIGPLFKRDASERELCAIESEFVQAKMSDAVRVQQVMAANVSVENHPYGGFGWGNKKSLKELPEQNGVAVLDLVKKFFDEYYSANIMKLVVETEKCTMDELENWVRHSFSKIPNKKVEIPNYGLEFKNLWQEKHVVYKILPLKDTHKMSLCWFLPPMMEQYKFQLDEYIAHLLGHESDGSILSLLMQKGWATQVNAGINKWDGYDYGTAGANFMISFRLTAQGMHHWPSVVEIVFQYILLMVEEKVPEWIFQELKDLANLNYTFIEAQEPIDYVEQLADIMQDRFCVDRNHLLKYHYVFDAFQPDTILQWLTKYLTVDNLQIYMTSSIFEKDESIQWTVEPWFEVKYTKVEIESTIIESWGKVGLNEALKLPVPNPFIPTCFQLCDSLEYNATGEPQLLVETIRGMHWYQADTLFRIPKQCCCILLATPFIQDSAKNMAVAAMYARLVSDQLLSYSYHASIAELEFDLRVEGTGFVINVVGFNDKLMMLLTHVLDAFRAPSFQRERFDLLKERLYEDYTNATRKPLRKAKEIRLLCLGNAIYSKKEVASQILNLTFDDMKHINYLNVLPDLHITSYFHGNMEKCNVQTIVSKVEESFPEYMNMDKSSRPCNAISKVSPGIAQIVNMNENEEDDNSVVEMYIQIGEWKDLLNIALADLIEQIMTEPLFDTLRTKQQLGYVVQCDVRQTSGILGYTITVQSADHTAEEVVESVESFLTTFADNLGTMDSATFESHVESLVNIKLEPDINLQAASHRIWYELEHCRYSFDLNSKLVGKLKSVTHKQMVEFYSKHFLCSSASRKALCVQVVSKSLFVEQENNTLPCRYRNEAAKFSKLF